MIPFLINRPCLAVYKATKRTQAAGSGRGQLVYFLFLFASGKKETPK
jgi:hypothetical protein